MPIETLTTLTLRELTDRLNAAGVEISYNSLSSMMGTGDIADQLRITGGANARRVPPEALGVLTAFLPAYRAAKARLPQAPAMLRSFLSQSSAVVQFSGSSEQAGALVASSAPASGVREYTATAVHPFSSSGELALQSARVYGRAQGLAMTERVLTAAQAAQVLQISVRLLRRSVPPFRRYGATPENDRWRLSDLVEG